MITTQVFVKKLLLTHAKVTWNYLHRKAPSSTRNSSMLDLYRFLTISALEGGVWSRTVLFATSHKLYDSGDERINSLNTDNLHYKLWARSYVMILGVWSGSRLLDCHMTFLSHIIVMICFVFENWKKPLQTILIQSRRRLTRHLIRLGTVLKTCCDEIMLKKHDFWFHAFYSQAYSCHFSINIRIAFS